MVVHPNIFAICAGVSNNYPIIKQIDTLVTRIESIINFCSFYLNPHKVLCNEIREMFKQSGFSSELIIDLFVNIDKLSYFKLKKLLPLLGEQVGNYSKIQNHCNQFNRAIPSELFEEALKKAYICYIFMPPSSIKEFTFEGRRFFVVKTRKLERDRFSFHIYDKVLDDVRGIIKTFSFTSGKPKVYKCLEQYPFHQIRKEISILQLFKSKHILRPPKVVKAIDSIWISKNRFIGQTLGMYPYVQGQTLSDYVRNGYRGEINHRTITLAKQMLNVVKTIRKHNVSHGDLHYGNWIIDEHEPKATLIDFSRAEQYNSFGCKEKEDRYYQEICWLEQGMQSLFGLDLDLQNLEPKFSTLEEGSLFLEELSKRLQAESTSSK